MSPSMPLTSMRSKVCGIRHGFSGRARSWSVNLCDSCSNFTMCSSVTCNGLSDSKHTEMTEVGLFHKTPHQILSAKLATDRREILSDFLGGRDI